jgi:LPS export ABC transporter protein LptC/lipopolysaccharide transport protein LptA
VSDPKEITLKEYRLRARMPQYIRFLAVTALGVAIIIVAAGFYRERTKTPFRLKGEHTQLSSDVVAEISGYERLETDGETPKYYIKADHAKTFSDNHQELRNVYLEVYAPDGVSKDMMSSETALYIPEQDKNFTAYFKGNVDIRTRQDLKVKTNHLVYTKSTEIAEADEAVEFDRDNVRGKSFGAVVNIAGKRIELLKDVEIEAFDSPELAKSNIRYAKINAETAVFDQAANNISLNRNVAINLVSRSKAGAEQTTDIHSGRALLKFTGEDAKTARLKVFELFDGVRIASAEQGRTPTNIKAGYAVYNKDADRFELKHGSRIATQAGDKKTEISGTEILYERSAGKAAISGGAEIRQAADVINGDNIFADLFANGNIKEAIVRGNASARQSTPERTTVVSGPELNALFTDSGILRAANAIGESSVEIVPQSGSEYTRIITKAGLGIGMVFKGEGLIESMRTDGRTTIQLNARSGDPGSSNKRVTADAVKTIFQANGKDLQKAEAVGNAELFVEPLTAGAKNYRTTINAPRFDCDFFPTGNNVRNCVAGKNAKAVRVPTLPTDRRGTQTLTSEVMTARFDQRSNDIEQLEASGSSKFNELDRNAIAAQFTFIQSTGILRMRGGEPTVWDARARAKANEIDWHTSENRSFLRGGVSTTYYNPAQMRGSSPFGSMGKPVFLTAANAEIDHTAETALYIGNARGWQDNNYVRGDRIFIDQKGGRFAAEGGVQSALYAARIRGGSGATVPTSASAGSMTYRRDSRLLQYRNNVDIRQGTDRITAGSADVFLDEKNELAKTIAENDVVITQPGRRATGSWAQYTAADEVAVLRGQPATVSDAESGSSQNAEITFFMRERRVVAEGKSKQNTSGRSRSVYKIKAPNE